MGEAGTRQEIDIRSTSYHLFIEAEWQCLVRCRANTRHCQRSLIFISVSALIILLAMRTWIFTPHPVHSIQTLPHLALSFCILQTPNRWKEVVLTKLVSGFLWRNDGYCRGRLKLLFIKLQYSHLTLNHSMANKILCDLPANKWVFDCCWVHTGCCKTSGQLWKPLCDSFLVVFFLFFCSFDCQLWAIFHFGTLWA